MKTLIGPSTAFASLDPVLSDGQFGYESDTEVLKVGNGVDPWSALTAIGGGGGGACGVVVGHAGTLSSGTGGQGGGGFCRVTTFF